NDTTCSWDVTNDGDLVDPICTTQDITVELDESGNASIVVSQINNGSTDNCAIDSITLSQYDFTMADIGTNTITMTVTDYSGNTSVCNAIVTVIENTLGIDDPRTKITVDIKPNPFNNEITISLPLSFNNESFNINIYDLNGRVVFKNIYTSNEGIIKVNGLHRLEEAPYFIKITNNSNGFSVMRKLIKH
ncbi:T9SS type A sorting domain-containing protein, partial [Flavobacteriaceae bacterium 144Ye]